MKLFKTNKGKWILTLVAFLLIAVTLVGFGIKLSRQEKTVSVNSFNYSVGSISSSTGKAVESHKAIYTKNMGNVDGLEIKVSEDATITYKVAFYDEDKEFIEMSTASAEDLENLISLAQKQVFQKMIFH